MVSCKQCNTLNSLDSTFCKRCGGTLAQDDIAEATEKLTAMIADGNKLFADGRTDEAMMVAETAVANNPSSAAAVSLKGMCHERKGQIAEALECFERVVELNPDSMLDKIKANDLRNMMVVGKLEVVKPDRRVAVVGAVAASVLVIAGGALLAKAMTKPPTSTPTTVASNENNLGVRTFGEMMGNNNPAQNQPAPQNSAANQPQGNTVPPPAQNNPSNNGSNQSQIDLPRYNANSLPRANEGVGGTLNDGNRPLTLNINPDGLKGPVNPNTTATNSNPNTGPTNTSQPPRGQDPDPGVMDGGDPPKKDPPKNDPGIVEISVVSGSGSGSGNRNVGGTSGSNNANGREALIQAARSQYLTGNYSAAANTYERALRSGADPASINQRLGQCYERMGRNSDAVAAYQRAANAIESALGSGSGDRTRLQSALESCRQAIKVLGG